MATDPFNREQERERRRVVGYIRGEPQFAGDFPAQSGGLRRSAPVAAASASAADAAIAAQEEENRQILQRGRAAQQVADRGAQRQAAGLTRVVRTAPGVYTDDPNATGDVRYYGAMGQRADVGVPEGITRNTSVADYNAAERAAAFDVNTEEGQNRLPGNARRQARGLGRVLADRQQQGDPGYQWEQTPTGPRVTTAAERAASGRGGSGGASFGDQVALLRLQRDINRDQRADAQAALTNKRADRQLNLQQQQFDAQELERIASGTAEQQNQWLNTQLGALTEASPAEQEAFFATPRGRTALSLFGQRLNQQAEQGSLHIGGLGRRTNINAGDLVEAPWYRTGFGLSPGYVAQGDEFAGALLSPQDLDLPPDILQMLMERYSRRNAEQTR